MTDNLFGYDEEFNYFDHLWTPVEHDGWTWVQTITGAPETYLLFDAHGELMGERLPARGPRHLLGAVYLGRGSLQKRRGCRQIRI